MFTVLISTEYLIHMYFLSKNICIYMYVIFDYQSFNNTLTKGIVSFEQLGPDLQSSIHVLTAVWVLIDPL